MGFEIDELSFRRQNQGRPLQHLVRELVQNVFDEDARFCTVEVAEEPDGLRIKVADGVKRGIRKIEEVFTIFASGKRDAPTKRGRLGRGMKEMVSVCDLASIETVGKTVEFRWDAAASLFVREIRDNAVTEGTTVTCVVPKAKSRRKEIADYLALFIAPKGVKYTVNGKEIFRPVQHRTIRAGLRTVVFDDAGTQRESERKTDVILWEPGHGREAWVYEMGIPVEPLQKGDSFRWHLDIQQRVPLRAERDRIARSYMRSLWAQILNQTVNELSREETATAWVDEATAHPAFNREAAGGALVAKRFGDKIVRASNVDDNVKAEQGGYNVVHTQSLSEGMREVMRIHAPSATEVVHPKNFSSIDDWLAKEPEVRVPEADRTDAEKDFVAFALRMAELLGVPVREVALTSMEQPPHVAHFTKRTSTVCVCREGTKGMPGHGDFFGRPRMYDWVDLLVHEFAHREGDGHDTAFQNEMSRLAGRLLGAAPTLLREFPRAD